MSLGLCLLWLEPAFGISPEGPGPSGDTGGHGDPGTGGGMCPIPADEGEVRTSPLGRPLVPPSSHQPL